ncbi:hypothetical protein [Neotabrizicola shimadae]|uniref:Autotransporter domain-containing protein n=1 Tax=Neotabrizicola shimadae TaxID=2807096 RepID=A0A8G0ZV87_9RHOB|nr:hypothetical protein [Neotabrizicola shimadae]QYZ70727.1 hypothetical protein JO391_04210 [Neotabrizicola shimadae]
MAATSKAWLGRGVAMALMLAPATAKAQDVRDQIRAQAAGALALLGAATVPNEAASTLSFSGGTETGGARFRGSQFGGGFNPDGSPLYLEGFLGWNSYDPVLLFDKDMVQGEAPTNWRSAALTAGVGWDFPIGAGMVFRPILDVAVGNITVDTPGDGPLEDVTSFLDDGVMATGLGGALMIEGNWMLRNDWEVDATLRHSHMWLQTTNGPLSAFGSAEAITSSAWARLRVPTPWQALRRPMRAVTEVAFASYTGDQAEILDTTWLAQIGIGAEIDLREAKLPWIDAGRLMLRYTRGDQVDGVSFGISADF